MSLLFFVIPLLLIGLWLASIRPYCLRHQQGYTTGATWGVTLWVDWQQAAEIARKRGDGVMMAICRIFLALQLLFGLMLAFLIFGSS